MLAEAIFSSFLPGMPCMLFLAPNRFSEADLAAYRNGSLFPRLLTRLCRKKKKKKRKKKGEKREKRPWAWQLKVCRPDAVNSNNIVRVYMLHNVVVLQLRPNWYASMFRTLQTIRSGTSLMFVCLPKDAKQCCDVTKHDSTH